MNQKSVLKKKGDSSDCVNKNPKKKKKEWGKENFELRYIVVKTKKRKEKKRVFIG